MFIRFSNSTTAFLAVSSKAAGFFILTKLVNGPFLGMTEFLLPLFGFIATFTIFGNLAACAQRNLKRMLGLSGVAHAGYLGCRNGFYAFRGR